MNWPRNLCPEVVSEMFSEERWDGETLPSEHDIARAYFDTSGRYRRLYDRDRKRWYSCEGDLWVWLPTTTVLDEIRWLTVQLTNGNRRVCNNNFFKGVEAIASRFYGWAVPRTIWDADPMLLGVPGGVVNLRSGELQRCLTGAHITKTTSVAPQAGEPVRFLSFLREACAGDEGLVRLLQQVFGYALTGLTTENVFVFIHGSGGNGKSVLINTVASIFHDYHRTAMPDTFMASKFDRHPTDLADLEGARLVTASETEAGRQLAEARVKQLTGGYPISARRMYQDPYMFQPNLTLVLSGNHQPVLRNVDEAIRRRMIIIPLTQKPKVVDTRLPSKLVQEYPQILQWLIDGCLDWQANGLVRPAVVENRTQGYFDDQDVRGQWLADRCERGAYFEESGALFRAWEEYAQERSEFAGSKRSHSNWLTDQGFENCRSPGGNRERGFRGLRLRTVEQPSTAPIEENEVW